MNIDLHVIFTYWHSRLLILSRRDRAQYRVPFRPAATPNILEKGTWHDPKHKAIELSPEEFQTSLPAGDSF